MGVGSWKPHKSEVSRPHPRNRKGLCFQNCCTSRMIINRLQRPRTLPFPIPLSSVQFSCSTSHKILIETLKKGKEGKDSTFTLSQRSEPVRSQLPYSVFVPHHRSFSPIPFWGQRIWLTLQGKLRSGVLLPVQWLVAILQLSRLPST